MGKLLQKIVNGIVPSWLTRVKSSAHASPKKLLPPPTSIKPSATSPPALNIILDHAHSGQSSKDDMATPPAACTESSALSCSVDSATPPSMQHKKTNIEQKDCMHEHDNDDHHQFHPHKIHRFEGNDDDHHHEHHAGMNDCSPGMYSPTTQIHSPNLLYELQAIDGARDENYHPLHHYRWLHVERPNCNHAVLLGSEKRSPCIKCMKEDDNSHYHQLVHGSQEDKKHNYKEYVHEAHNGYDHQSDIEQKNYRNLLGLKRKRRYLEEDEDEEEKRGDHGSGIMRGWGWKRRKKEEGLMSCELPKSVCGIVGNAKAVVKYSQEPDLALWESMVEMIVGNGLWELGSLEFLLFCYLSLNEPHLYPIIQSSFLRVLKDLERTF